MDDADEIILLTVKDLGCEVEHNITIKEFDADIFYKCLIQYLKAINADKVSNLTATIPKNMSARVNTSIKESWMPYFCPFTKRIPGNYSTARLFTTGPVKIPARGRQVKVTPGLEYYYINVLPPVTLQPQRADDIAPSVFEYNLSVFADTQEREREWSERGVSSGLSPVEYAKQKQRGVSSRMDDSIRSALVDGGVGLEGRRGNGGVSAGLTLDDIIGGFSGRAGGEDMNEFARKMLFTTEQGEQTDSGAAVASGPKETEEERLEKQRQELDELQSSLTAAVDEIAETNRDMEEFMQLLRQLEADINEEDGRRGDLEKQYKIKKKTFALLDNADENLKQLQMLCQQSSAALIEMAGEWERVRRPIVDKFRALRDERANQNDEAKSKLERVKEMRALIKKLIAEIRAKEELFGQLQETYKNAPKDTNRSMYTRRILDTVKNIKKQKVDIDKILLDTKTLQKEINTITDSAVRAFDNVKDILYADAKKDETAKLAIKSFAVIDEKFQSLLLAIDETGTYQNNILTLTSKIDHISQKTNTLNSDRVLNDLKNIKTDNQNLIKQIKTRMAANKSSTAE
ncbi:hypothetical protein DFA_06355 [Cavenderia fasciculata]|uniref:CCDC22 coiled-coil domain-containing protein n=1 Tax=Cavenderia fasciculata TaxID=261658 RepID=F4PKT4_CACFS|nr:uncharacterized protein DFA_06355 [Cavenderia fasciculata]EGG24208.1 hypothetical protein DFA_06355 [Cavenderia fasciculata]|eukprot:XP_004362059.1 hypothetical protein DFA_06355 [Cavenderia fasciculata]